MELDDVLITLSIILLIILISRGVYRSLSSGEAPKRPELWVESFNNENLGERITFETNKHHVLFPELLPKTVTMYEHKSFIYFLRNAVPGFYWFNNGFFSYSWVQKPIDVYLEGSLLTKGLSKTLKVVLPFKFLGKRADISYIVAAMPVIQLVVYSMDAWINILIFIVSVLIVLLNQIRILDTYAENWRLTKRKTPHEEESYEYWNIEILKAWKNNFPKELENHLEQNNIFRSHEEISEVKKWFLQTVSKSTMVGENITIADAELDEKLLHRFRMIFVWSSPTLTKKYQEYQELTDEDVKLKIEEDIHILSSPLKEHFSKTSGDHLRSGLQRIDIEDDKIEEYLEDTQFWLSRAIIDKQDEKTKTTFYQEVLEYTGRFRVEDRFPPMILASRAASGKSTIVNMLCLEENENKVLAIKLDLSEISGLKTTKSLLDFLLERFLLKKEKDLEWKESLIFFFGNRSILQRDDINQPLPLIILDGLDEIDEEKNHWKKKIIDERHDIPILLTSRPEVGFEKCQYFKFDGLTNSQKKKLIALKYSKVEDKLIDALSVVIDNKSEITGKELVSPFMFFLILKIIDIDKNENIEKIDLSLDKISRTFIKRIIEREWDKKDRFTMDDEDVKNRIPIEIGKKLLGQKSDEIIINLAVKLTLLGPGKKPLDNWLKGHYYARYFDSKESSSFELHKIIRDKEDEERNLILNHLISTSPKLFAPDSTPDFGEIAPLIYKIIAEDWLDKNSEGKEKLIEDLGIKWEIGQSDLIDEEILSNLSEKDLSIISGIIHLHCWIIGSNEKSLASWRESERDQAWEQLMMIAFNKIEKIRVKKEEITEIHYQDLITLSKNSRRQNPDDGDFKRFLFDYLNGSPISEPVEELRHFHTDKILRHFEFFKGLNHGVPTAATYLSFIFDSKEYIDMLLNTDMWLPRNHNLDKTTRRRNLISGNSDSKPLISLILKIIEGYPSKSMIFFLSVIESLAREITLSVSYEDLEKIEQQMNKDSKTNSNSIKSFPQRLINLRLKENIEIYEKKNFELEEKKQNSEEIFKVVINKSSKSVRVFSLDGEEMDWFTNAQDVIENSLFTNQSIQADEAKELYRESKKHKIIRDEIHSRIKELAKEENYSRIKELAKEENYSRIKELIRESKKHKIIRDENHSRVNELISESKKHKIIRDENHSRVNELISESKKHTKITDEINRLRAKATSSHEAIIEISIEINTLQAKATSSHEAIIEIQDEINTLQAKAEFKRISIEIGRLQAKADSSHEAYIEIKEKLSPFTYDSNRIRFFDKSFSEIELNKIPYDEFTGNFKITVIEADMIKISPILLENNSINKVRKIHESNPINVLTNTPNSDYNSIITIVNIDQVKEISRHTNYETLLNHNKFKNFVSKITIAERDIAAEVTQPGQQLVILQANPDYAKPGKYLTNLAIPLSHVSKKFLINPPDANVELSTIVNKFNNNHSLSNHLETKKKLKSLREEEGKILFYFKPGKKNTFYEPHYTLGIPGVMDRDLPIPVNDPITKPITDALQHGKWYQCHFELKPTSLGYELILPILDTIEIIPSEEE